MIDRTYYKDKKTWEVSYTDTFLGWKDMDRWLRKRHKTFLYATHITNDKETKDNQAWLIQETTEN